MTGCAPLHAISGKFWGVIFGWRGDGVQGRKKSLEAEAGRPRLPSRPELVFPAKVKPPQQKESFITAGLAVIV